MTPKLNAPLPGDLNLLQADAAARQGLATPPNAAAYEDWGGADAAASAQARRMQAPAIIAGLQAGGAQWVEFLSPRPGGDLLFGCDGVVYRLGDWRSVAPERRLAQARALLGLNGLSFKRVPPPPEAMRW